MTDAERTLLRALVFIAIGSILVSLTLAIVRDPLVQTPGHACRPAAEARR